MFTLLSLAFQLPRGDAKGGPGGRYAHDCFVSQLRNPGFGNPVFSNELKENLPDICPTGKYNLL